MFLKISYKIFIFGPKLYKMDIEKQTHPLIALARKIDERGLVVFENIHGMPTYDEPYTTPNMVIVLNLQGWVRAECDMRPLYFREHQIAVLSPNHTICAHEASPDYHAILIAMSSLFQDERKKSNTNIYCNIFNYLQPPDMELNEEQFAVIYDLFYMVKAVSLIDSPNRDEMLGHLLDLLFLWLHEYRRQNGVIDHQLSSQELIFNKFYEAITIHYRESREVRFYAQLFHLTPKHFASIIKQHTKINALKWINGYVVTQAKMLLLYQQQLTVQEVSIKLGFPDLASFSRFFKTNVGLSPSEFREQH